MKKNTKTFLVIALITLIAACTKVPLSDNLISSVPELNGQYEFGDSLIVKFDVADDKTVKFTQYKPDGNGNFESESDEYDLPIYFTDIKHKGKIRHFMSVQYKSDAIYYITKEFSMKKGNLIIINLNQSYIDWKFKVEDFETSEKFKKFMTDNIDNPDIFIKEKQLFTKREL
ncbi:hypothetical protein [Flavobacterium sp.]|uniref:hypothetical protein n=1 Tax=Flavobacterium sp. TaxID=239 RepID=UPI00286CA391|nr:hypothetical protein [Flavobacterium sp.]